MKNEAANAPIGIEEFVMVMINPFLITYFFIFASNMLHFFSLSFQTLSVAMLKITYPVFCCLKRKPFQCQLQINELLLPYEHIFHLHPLVKVFILSSSFWRKKCTSKSAMQTLFTITYYSIKSKAFGRFQRDDSQWKYACITYVLWNSPVRSKRKFHFFFHVDAFRPPTNV